MKLNHFPNDMLPHHTPNGARLIEAYEDKGQIVILGTPDDDDSEHNCDAMGCGWHHVVMRIPIPRKPS